MGNRHPSIAPYDTFAAADGEFVLSVGNDDQFRRLCATSCGAPGAGGRLALRDERGPRPQLRRAAGRTRRAVFGSWRRADLLAALTAAGVPCGAVRSVTEALADPQLAAREMIVPLEHATAGAIRVLGTPLKLSETRASVRTPPPALGQHTDAVLREIGLSESDIASLRAQKAIA